MPLRNQLTEQMKQALKAHDAETLSTLRLLLADLKNFEIDHGPQEDEGIIKIVQKMVKQWQDASVEYQQGNRQDLVDEAAGRVTVLKTFLPVQMSDQDLESVIIKVIEVTGNKNLGPLIGLVMKEVGNQADGKRVAEMAKQVLAKSAI